MPKTRPTAGKPTPPAAQVGTSTKPVLEATPDGVLLKRSPMFPQATMEDVLGAPTHDGPLFCTREMRAAIGAEVKRRHARGRY